MRAIALLLCLLPLSCGPARPDLDSVLSPQARVAEFPRLVALGPLLAQAEAPLPRSAAAEGTSLEARAEDLRRRAAALRAMSL